MKWTPENIETIKGLWLEGLSATLIGKRFGVTRNSIIGLVYRAGLRRDAPTIPVRDSAKWTPDMDTRLRRMVNDGKTRNEIADAFGLGYNQILSRCRTLKLKVKDARKFTFTPFSGASGAGAQSSARKAQLGTLNGPASIITEAPDPNIKGFTCVEIPARGACKWPLTGAGADMVMCGQNCGDGVYCAPHTAMAWAPSTTDAKSLYRSVRRYA